MRDTGITVTRQVSIGTITINRPDVHNALDASALAGIHRALTDLVDDGVRAVIVTGEGSKAFSAGADLNELAGLDASAAHTVLRTGQRAMEAIAASPIPVIAAVNGVAVGGGFELVLACTFAIFADTATVGLPESGLGLIPGYGGTQRLPALIGRSTAAHVMLTGRRLDAQRCYDLGLSPVPPVPLALLMETAMTTAQEVASKAPGAQSAILAALRTSAPDSTGLWLESALAGIITSGDEATEGIAAFREKRAPRFAGSSTT